MRVHTGGVTLTNGVQTGGETLTNGVRTGRLILTNGVRTGCVPGSLTVLSMNFGSVRNC